MQQILGVTIKSNPIIHHSYHICIPLNNENPSVATVTCDLIQQQPGDCLQSLLITFFSILERKGQLTTVDTHTSHSTDIWIMIILLHILHLYKLNAYVYRPFDVKI